MLIWQSALALYQGHPTSKITRQRSQGTKLRNLTQLMKIILRAKKCSRQSRYDRYIYTRFLHHLHYVQSCNRATNCKCGMEMERSYQIHIRTYDALLHTTPTYSLDRRCTAWFLGRVRLSSQLLSLPSACLLYRLPPSSQPRIEGRSARHDNDHAHVHARLFSQAYARPQCMAARSRVRANSIPQKWVVRPMQLRDR